MKAATPWPRWKRKRHWKQTPMKRPGLLAPKWSPGTKGWNKGMAILSICEALLALSNSYISTLEMAILERRYIFPTISFWYVRFRWRSPCNTRILSLGGYPNWKVCLTYFLDCKSHHCRSRAMVAYEVHSLKKTIQTRETWWFLCADFLFCFFFVIIYRCKKLMVLMAKLKQGRKFHVDLALWGIGLPFTLRRLHPKWYKKSFAATHREVKNLEELQWGFEDDDFALSIGQVFAACELNKIKISDSFFLSHILWTYLVVFLTGLMVSK